MLYKVQGTYSTIQEVRPLYIYIHVRKGCSLVQRVLPCLEHTTIRARVANNFS